jgi:dihydrofolate reductase
LLSREGHKVTPRDQFALKKKSQGHPKRPIYSQKEVTRSPQETDLLSRRSHKVTPRDQFTLKKKSQGHPKRPIYSQEEVTRSPQETEPQLGKNILKYGTGNLDGTLIQHGLIDELNFVIFPAVAGKGT